jgi:hypothetical protein
MSSEKIKTLYENAKEYVKDAINHKDEHGNTLLHYAVLNNSSDKERKVPNFNEIEALLKLGADPLIKNNLYFCAHRLAYANGWQDNISLYNSNGLALSSPPPPFINESIVHQKQIAELVMKYQPTAENIKVFFLEYLIDSFSIPYRKIPEEDLKDLIKWKPYNNTSNNADLKRLHSSCQLAIEMNALEKNESDLDNTSPISSPVLSQAKKPVNTTPTSVDSATTPKLQNQ